MNKKNIELDFIRRYNTLQTIRYLIDGGEDDRVSAIGQGFSSLTTDSLLYPILSDWYMTQDIQKETIHEDVSDGKCNFFLIYLYLVKEFNCEIENDHHVFGKDRWIIYNCCYTAFYNDFLL